MAEPSSSPLSPSRAPLSALHGTPLRLIAYGTLLVLLAASVLATGLPLGPWRIALHFTLALVQAGVILSVYAGLRVAPPLVRFMAVGSVLWLAMMFGFTLLDYAHR